MRRISWMIALGAVALGAVEARAASLTYYYVGNPYEVNNLRGPDRPLMTVGRLELDPSALPGGSPANRTITSTVDWEATVGYDHVVVSDPAFRSLTIDRIQSSPSRHSLSVDVGFDAAGAVSRWSFAHEPHDIFCFVGCYRADGDAATGHGRDGYIGLWGENMSFWALQERDRFLRNLGWTERNPQYWAYMEDENLWGWERLATGAGHWFDNLHDAARQIEANTALALANPARSIHDIAPIPVPAPLALLATGLAGLVLVGRRRRDDRAGPSAAVPPAAI